MKVELTQAQKEYLYSKENLERLKRFNAHPKINISKETLEKLYLKKKLSLRKIARIFRVDKKVISERCKEYGIPLRYVRDPTSFANLKETDFAYLAGLMDGEGTITILKRFDRGKIKYQPVITISNTRKEILTFVSKVFNKKIDRNHVLMSKINDILTFLPHVLPYLKLKNKQAKIVLQFCKIRKENLERLYFQYTKMEEKLHRRIKELNKKGKK